MKKKNQSGSTVDFQFARELGSSEDWAVLKGAFYHWEGSHWEMQSDDKMKRRAFTWLTNHFPEEIKAHRAEQLVKAALLYCNPLMEITSRNIVPTKDCYLEIHSDGSIQAFQPERDLGMTYVVNADIGCHQGVYLPADLPRDSHFFRFISSSLPLPEVRQVVQEYVGYTLITSTKFQVGQLWLGEGRNGKSVLLEIVQALHDKIADMRLDHLDSFALFPLFGASLACVSEAPKADIKANVLKAAIAGDSIQMEKKYLDAFSHKPTAKWLMAANDFIRSGDHSDGWWRRFQIIPWSVQIPKSEVIPDLAKLICKEELNLVLNWALQGVSRLLVRNGFEDSSPVLNSTKQEAIEASNPVAAWLAEIEPVPHQTGMPKSEVYAAFRDWANANGHRPPSSNTFWGNMKKQLKTRFQMDKRHQVQNCGKSVDYVRFAFGDALRNMEPPWDNDTPMEVVQPQPKAIQRGERF